MGDRKKKKAEKTLGFRRGFLLASGKSQRSQAQQKTAVAETKVNRNKCTTISSSLLGFEKEQSDSLLFIRKDAEHPSLEREDSSDPSSSSVLLFGNDKDEGGTDQIGLVEVSTSERRPLISELAEQEQPSSFFIDGSGENQFVRNPPPANHESNTDDEKEISAIQVLSGTSPVAQDSAPAIDSKVDEGKDETAFSALNKELARTLWHLRQTKRDWRSVADAFINQSLSTEERWHAAWKALLQSLSQATTNGKAPEIRLGIALMERRFDSLLCFLKPSTHKESRRCTLAAIDLMERWTDIIIENSHLLSLVESAVPSLVGIVPDSCKTRTVLAQRASEVSHLVFTMGCERVCTGGPVDEIDRLAQALWRMAPLIDQLWMMQESWIDEQSKEKISTELRTISDVRNRCKAAVLADWRLMFVHHRGLFERSLPEDHIDRLEAENRLEKDWCRKIAGGFCINAFGSLRQTLCRSARHIATDEIASQLSRVDEMLALEHSEFDQKSHEVLRTIFRGIVAWLGQKGVNFEQFLADQESLQHSDIFIRLLRFGSHECIELVFAILNALWSRSKGLPPDVTTSTDQTLEDRLPESFTLLVDILVSKPVSTKWNESTSQTVYRLLARCILFRGEPLLGHFISRSENGDYTLGVLWTIMTDYDGLIAGLPSKCAEKRDQQLLNVVGNSLIRHVKSSAYARKKVSENCNIFTQCSSDSVIPSLVKLFFADCGENNDADDDVASLLAKSLLCVLKQHSVSDPEHTASVLAETLLSLELEMPENESIRRLTDTFCSSIGREWRSSLVFEASFSDVSNFARVLVSIGNTFFSNPSRMNPLVLFGCVVGEAFDSASELSSLERQSVAVAVADIIEISLKKFGSIVAEQCSSAAPDIIFHRLCPLLLLRRIPVQFFRLTKKEDFGSDQWTERVTDLFTSLSDHIAQRLGMIPSTGNHGSLSPQERGLAAEIAGRSLLIADRSRTSGSTNCFQCRCIQALTGLMADLRNPHLKSDTYLQNIRSARAALFAFCYKISSSDVDDEGDAVLQAASFSFHVLNSDSNSHDDEFAKLQAGCIEFFALCIQRQLDLRCQRLFSSDDSSGMTMPEIHDRQSSLSFISALDCIDSELRRALYTGNLNGKWVNRGINSDALENPSLEVKLSVPACVCLWNTIVVVSQRLDPEKLKGFARTTLPWVFEWGTDSGGGLRHPLCVAAAMQVAFVQLTRTKTVTCLSGKCGDGQETIRKAHKWAVETLRRDYSVAGDYSRQAERSAALKLMMSMVSTDAGCGVAGALADMDIAETLETLQGIANLDSDPDLRLLASRLLEALIELDRIESPLTTSI